MAQRVIVKTLFSVAAYSAGILWGLAAEAYAVGMPLIGVFQG